MSISLILLAVVSALVLFGVAQRVLDRMQLSDRAALVIAAAIFIDGLLPDLRLEPVALNVEGFLVPLGVCIWLLGSVLTAVAVYALGHLMPSEPEQIVIDPNYLYGAAWLIVALLIGALVYAFAATGNGKPAVQKWKRTFREMTGTGKRPDGQ